MVMESTLKIINTLSQNICHCFWDTSFRVRIFGSIFKNMEVIIMLITAPPSQVQDASLSELPFYL